MKLDSIHEKSTGFYVGDKPKNIPTNSLTVIDKITDCNYCHVRQVRQATIQLTGFAIVQFLEGAELEVKDIVVKMMSVDDVKLILRLSKSTTMLRAEPVTKIDVTYGELKTLRKWLELRMLHCEQERDNRTKNANGFEVFNPDTYIGMKLLLLDLRELMLGEIIPE